ncbi:nuclear factor 7, ovary-like isoform X4 [Clupea harengus]|uniref:Nuclear factor 7, ovary-like isoform X4 n=1 Tax=Clupea harengus TaxID=7950 RepID=A0A8M1KSE1_CLUHA|nr:nuclear factor 7, ovary-like isoform X4 [Clupea harengus]
MEMTEGSFRKLDPDGVNRPSMDKHEETDTGRWKRAAVCLGLLCALLLSAIALLSFKMMENKQLQTSYNNLNREKSQLQTSYNNLTKEKSQLQDKFHTMAAEKDKLQKRLCNLRMEITKYAVDVTLDPDTAHNSLILSADGKQVRHGNSSQNRPDNPKRFSLYVCVLGKQGFTSGRFYYEVEVSGKTEWDLGVARESINRKGKITLSPKNGYWTIWLRNGDEYMALADPSVVLSLKEKLERVGVFVDYEAGLVSFYDADRSNLIYSFQGVSFKEKIYPYFSPSLHDDGKNSSPLIIMTQITCPK